jgi:hypothetical protein
MGDTSEEPADIVEQILNEINKGWVFISDEVT